MILLPLSGGTDSVAALWHLRDRDIRVFHLLMGAHWQRVEAELQASRDAMRWMEGNGHFTGSWRYSEIELPRTSPWGMRFDIPSLGVWIGAIVRSEPDIESVCRVIIADGSDVDQFSSDATTDSIKVAEALAGRPFRWEFPFKDTSKAALYAETPELRAFAISCWDPILDPETGRWRQCGLCAKCSECRRCGLPI